MMKVKNDGHASFDLNELKLLRFDECHNDFIFLTINLEVELMNDLTKVVLLI